MRNGMSSLKAIYMTWFTEYLSFPGKNFSEHILDYNYTSATNTVLFSDLNCDCLCIYIHCQEKERKNMCGG